jgi:5-methylthioadenosine/S-adenosylhomocysteine deaminase
MIKVIKNGTVITMDEKKEKHIENLDIVIEDNKIIDLVSNYDGSADEIIDATNKIVMPGLINCHTHLGMSIFRSINDNNTLNDWLTKQIWPVESKMTKEDVYYATLLSIVEMIKTGTTCCNDMYIEYEGTIKAAQESHFRIMLGRSLMDSTNEGEKQLEDFKELYQKYPNSELMRWTLAPHSLYTCSKNYIKKLSDLALKMNLPIHIHFCENENEIKEIHRIHKKNPIQALEKYGLLRNKLILAHGTFIDKKEIKKLKGKDISIAHNPISNLDLGCGVANITSYKDYVNLCLGTDGQGSGNNMNLFYHMSVVDLLQKGILKNPTIFNSYEVLKMATINGAKALGLDKEIGSIEIGKKADIIILDLNKNEIYSSNNLITNIVHNTTPENIETTMINGEILFNNHKLVMPLNEDVLRKKITNIMHRLNI